MKPARHFICLVQISIQNSQLCSNQFCHCVYHLTKASIGKLPQQCCFDRYCQSADSVLSNLFLLQFKLQKPDARKFITQFMDIFEVSPIKFICKIFRKQKQNTVSWKPAQHLLLLLSSLAIASVTAFASLPPFPILPSNYFRGLRTHSLVLRTSGGAVRAFILLLHIREEEAQF